MLYPYFMFEAACLSLTLILLHTAYKRLPARLAAAITVNIGLSVFILIGLGLASFINIWLYVFLKGVLMAGAFLLLLPRLKVSLKQIYHELASGFRSIYQQPVGWLVAALFVCLFLNASGRFPVSWDSYSYHLPVAANLMKNGMLSHYQYYGIPIGAYYPHSIELFYALFFSLNGIECSSLMNFPSLVLLFLGLYLIARDILKVSREISMLGAALFLFFPLISTAFYEADVDLYFVSFCLLALYMIFRFIQSPRRHDMLFLFLLLSLMMGTRYQGLSLAVFFSIFILLILAQGKDWRLLDLPTLMLILVVLALGSFFYLRNAFLTGNPVFPLNIQMGKYFELHGHYDYGVLTVNTAILFNLSRIAREAFYVIVKELSIGLPFLVFVWSAVSLNFKRFRTLWQNHRPLRTIKLVCLLAFVYFLITPYSAVDTGGGFNFSLRLGLPFLSLLYLFTLGAVQVLPPRLVSGLMFVSLAGLAAGSGFTTLSNLAAVCIPTLILILLRSRKKAAVLAPGLSVLFLVVFLLINPSHKKWEADFSINTLQRNLNIAYAGSNRHFQLYDRHLSNNLIYINVDREQQFKWNFERDVAYHKQTGDFLLWLKNMRREDIDYLVLFSRRFSYIENRWVKDHPDIFLRERGNIFRVNKAEMRKHLSDLQESR